MFTVWSALSPLLCENFKKSCQQTPWLVLQHLWPHSQSITSKKKTTMSTPPDWSRNFGTHIQSLRSVNHPIHRIPKAARLSFASGKLTKPFLQTRYLIGISNICKATTVTHTKRIYRNLLRKETSFVYYTSSVLRKSRHMKQKEKITHCC